MTENLSGRVCDWGQWSR